MREWLIPAIAAVFCWAGWAFLPKISVQYIDSKSVLVYEVLGGLIVGLLVFINLDYKLDLHWKGFTLAILSGMLNIAGVLFYLKAISLGKVSLISTVSSLYPVIVVILAFVFLQESLSFKQIFGLGFGCLSIILLAT